MFHFLIYTQCYDMVSLKVNPLGSPLIHWQSQQQGHMHSPAPSISFSHKKNLIYIINVFRTGPVIEPEKLPVHGSLVGPAVEPRSNRGRTGDVINI